MSTEIKIELDRIESNIAAAYAAAEEQGANIPEAKNTDNLPGTVSSIKSVKFTKQELTEEQQKQARENIGAVSVDDIGTAAGAYYEQDEEPEDAPVGSFWMDTDEETNSAPGGYGGMADLTDEEYSTLVALLEEGIM